MLRKPKAQTTLDYAMTIAVVVAALLAMKIYMKRGIEGRLREAADDVGGQFEAEKTGVTSTRSRTVTTVEETVGGGTISYMGEAGKGTAEKVSVTGSESVDAW